jgi:hypothetical protein
LTDEDVDAYVAGRLPEERERGLELHYLECAPCLARVTAIQDLAHGLRAARRPRAGVPVGIAAVAAALALLGFALLLQGGPSGRTPRQAASASPAAPPPALPRFSLRAPERGASLQELRLPAAPALLLLLEARELGPAGSVFDVELLDAKGRSLLVVRALPSDGEGRVLLPVATALLRPGSYVVQVSARDTLKIPFEVAPAR